MRFLLFLFIVFSVPAAAQEIEMEDILQSAATGYSCNIDGFTMRRAATFSDEKARFFLNGVLDMPTPGYGYSMRLDNQNFDEHEYTMIFQKPEGMALQVISPLPIEYEFVAIRDLDVISIDLENGPVDIGTDKIVCRKDI